MQVPHLAKAKLLPYYGEWFYGVERPRVIVEKYLEGDGERFCSIASSSALMVSRK